MKSLFITLTKIVFLFFTTYYSYAHEAIDYINTKRGEDILGAELYPNLGYDFDERYLSTNRCIKGEHIKQKNIRLHIIINKNKNSITSLKNNIQGKKGKIDLIILSASKKSLNSNYFMRSKTKLTFSMFLKVDGFNTFIYNTYNTRKCHSRYVSGIYRGLIHKLDFEMEFFKKEELEKFVSTYTTGFFWWEKTYKKQEIFKYLDKKAIVLVKHYYIGRYDKQLSAIHGGSLQRKNIIRCSSQQYQYCLDKVSSLFNYLTSKNYLKSIIKKNLLVILGLRIDGTLPLSEMRKKIKQVALLDTLYQLETRQTHTDSSAEKQVSIKFREENKN